MLNKTRCPTTGITFKKKEIIPILNLIDLSTDLGLMSHLVT
jgi:hypothetical protein